MHAIGGMTGMPVWFVSNELMLRQRTACRGGARDQVPLWEKLVCGATGGALSWIPAYPADKIKTLWQTHQGQDARAESVFQFVRCKLRREGIAFLYRGFGATLVRAIPQTGMTIAMYDVAKARFCD